MQPKPLNGRLAVAEAYEDLRPLLFSIAYRMLGSVSEAEDIVQEAFLRYHVALERTDRIESPRAYLSAVTTRLAIDHLRSARARKESHGGGRRPEPVVAPAHARPRAPRPPLPRAGAPGARDRARGPPDGHQRAAGGHVPRPVRTAHVDHGPRDRGRRRPHRPVGHQSREAPAP